MTSIDGKLPGTLLVLAATAVAVAVFTPWAVIGYRDDADPGVLLIGLRPSEDNLHDAVGPVVLVAALLLLAGGAAIALTRPRWVHLLCRVLGGLVLLGLAGLTAVLWYGVLGSREEVAELSEPDFVIGPATGPLLVDPGVGLWAISAGVLLGLVAVVVPGRRRRVVVDPAQQPLPPPGWYPQGSEVHYWDGRAWTGHVQPR